MALISCDPAMALVGKLVEKAANCFANVLIVGESGVGKTYVARRIHEASPVASEGFHTLQCYPGMEAGIAGTDLVEALKLLEARGGTAFIKGIQNLTRSQQQRLLAYLDRRDRQVLNRLRKRVRLIFATRSDLRPGLASDFSRSLYMRIAVITITVPPLRERRQDILSLARMFLKQYSSEENRNLWGFSRDAEEILLKLPWHGNIHELKNIINRAVVMAEDGEVVDGCALMGVLQGILS